jgi:hypothetical protein
VPLVEQSEIQRSKVAGLGDSQHAHFGLLAAKWPNVRIPP